MKRESGQGMTLDNFVLNFSVISGKAISLTFSCGILKGEESRFFSLPSFFLFSVSKVIYLVFLQKPALLNV